MLLEILKYCFPSGCQTHTHNYITTFIVSITMCYYNPGMEEETRLAMQDQLVDVIMWVLVTHPELHYYQGYHDIVVTFLLVLGEHLTFGVMDKLSKQHLRFVGSRILESFDWFIRVSICLSVIVKPAHLIYNVYSLKCNGAMDVDKHMGSLNWTNIYVNILYKKLSSFTKFSIFYIYL